MPSTSETVHPIAIPNSNPRTLASKAPSITTQSPSFNIRPKPSPAKWYKKKTGETQHIVNSSDPEGQAPSCKSQPPPDSINNSTHSEYKHRHSDPSSPCTDTQHTASTRHPPSHHRRPEPRASCARAKPALHDQHLVLIFPGLVRACAAARKASAARTGRDD
ncbi:hypothetical protein BS50DRAFT_240092 [Corynespora cassiicola Philippines]|uniref:Uncharacterized protein n=1 Tax=Corynespora cassiicola Philippines TaxID=1448308 RepID=A0A2T2P2P9_CORCC|nr:hypothetical protein BS50DRAFT_240092 [Corynespora cassiicola Philippines]